MLRFPHSLAALHLISVWFLNTTIICVQSSLCQASGSTCVGCFLRAQFISPCCWVVCRFLWRGQALTVLPGVRESTSPLHDLIEACRFEDLSFTQIQGSRTTTADPPSGSVLWHSELSLPQAVPRGGLLIWKSDLACSQLWKGGGGKGGKKRYPITNRKEKKEGGRKVLPQLFLFSWHYIFHAV